MPVLDDKIKFWCGQCNKWLTEAGEHKDHKPLRRVGIDGDGMFWWVYGEFGTHKTRFAITFPPPIEFYDVDLGTRSIVNETRELGDQIHMVHYDPEDPDTHRQLVEAVGNFHPEKFASLILDSGDSLERAAMTRSMEASHHDFMELNDWNPSGERFGQVIRQLKWYALAYGVQVLVTSNEDIDKEYIKGAFVKEGKSLVAQEPISIKGLPSLSGKWAKKSARLPDIILHSRYLNGSPVFCARRESVGGGGANWETKDRTGKLENTLIQYNGKPYANGYLPPHWPTLWKCIKGGA
jgi:hypothetical protein